MSKKLTFEEWFYQCGFHKDGYDCNQVSSANSAWNFCRDQEQREIDELKKKVEELAVSAYSLAKENESIKKKLERAEKVITFYSIAPNYGYSREHDNHVEWINDEEHQSMGKKARDYLKENEG